MIPWIAKILAARNKAKDFVSENTTDNSRFRIGTAVAVIILVFVALAFGKKLIAAARRFIHKDIRKIEYDKNNLSYPKSEYSSFNSTLESAMQYTGTDEDSIYDVIRKMKNQDDWNFLIKLFGTRTKYSGPFEKDVTGDLKMWLIDELDDAERQKLRELLAENNISF